MDKVIAMIWFVSSAFFFYAGVTASNINFMMALIFLFFGAVCIAGSIWFVRKEF